jgi:DNA mismatch repair ATPase MutS
VIRKLVNEMLEAREHCDSAMRNIKVKLYAKFDEHYNDWMGVVRRLGELDGFCSLATCKMGMEGTFV